jgi:CDP-diacylglycerol---glycerol-3-phosphate 3-phosphatidyltransferase
VGIYGVKPMFRRLLKPLERALIRLGISADAVTAAGMVFAGTAALGEWLGRRGSIWLVVVPVAGFCRTAANALDGMIATDTGRARPMGEVFNETADRAADVAMFLPLAFVPGVSDVLVAGALGAMLVTSFLGMAVKAAGGPRVYTGIMGKPDRMLVLGLSALIAVWAPPGPVFTAALWVVVGGCFVTFAQRVVAARRALASAGDRK